MPRAATISKIIEKDINKNKLKVKHKNIFVCTKLNSSAIFTATTVRIWTGLRRQLSDCDRYNRVCSSYQSVYANKLARNMRPNKCGLYGHLGYLSLLFWPGGAVCQKHFCCQVGPGIVSPAQSVLICGYNCQRIIVKN